MRTLNHELSSLNLVLKFAPEIITMNEAEGGGAEEGWGE